MMRLRFLTAAACFLVAALMPVRASAQSEVVEYYALDAIGSVRVVFDANGAITSRRDYAPFGEVVTSITADPKVYAGLFRDDESTLDYAQARMYQSNTGRFTAVDPVYAGLFEPQKWNRYTYVANRPLSHVDATGLDSVCATDFCEEVVGRLPPPTYDEAWWASFLANALKLSDLFGPRDRDFLDNLDLGAGSGREDQQMAASPQAAAAAAALTAIANMARSPQVAQSVERATKVAQSQYSKLADLIQKHHVIPIYLGGPKSGPVVPLNGAYHQLVTNAFRQAWNYGQSPPTAEQLKQIVLQVYTQLPIPLIPRGGQ